MYKRQAEKFGLTVRACFMTRRSDVFWSTNKASTPIRRSGGVAAPAMVFLPTLLFWLPNAHTAHNLGPGQRELDNTCGFVRLPALARVFRARASHSASVWANPLA